MQQKSKNWLDTFDHFWGENSIKNFGAKIERKFMRQFSKFSNTVTFFNLHIGTFGVKSVASVISSIVTSTSLLCENPVL